MLAQSLHDYVMGALYGGVHFGLLRSWPRKDILTRHFQRMELYRFRFSISVVHLDRLVTILLYNYKIEL
jgi:hypothetical protein